MKGRTKQYRNRRNRFLLILATRHKSKQIGVRLGLSSERVRQLIARARRKTLWQVTHSEGASDKLLPAEYWAKDRIDGLLTNFGVSSLQEAKTCLFDIERRLFLWRGRELLKRHKPANEAGE